MWSVLIRTYGGRVGRGLVIEGGAHVRWSPHAGWNIGEGVYIGRGVILDCPRGGELVIGDDVQIMHYSVIAATLSIRIGDRAGIGEHCSVRDQDHELSGAIDPPLAPVRAEPIVIESGVWIGRGSAVLKGVHLGTRCVVAANSVVRGRFEASQLLAGAPARWVREL